MDFRLIVLNIKQFCPQLSVPVIKQRVNVRYQQILGYEDWEFLNSSTTLSTISGTVVYSPVVGNVAEIRSMTYETDMREVSQEYLNRIDPERETTGSPQYWYIDSKSSALGIVSFGIWPEPDDVYVITVNYKKAVSDMSADTDTPVFRTELLESGSLWDCYRLVYGITQNPAYIGMARDAQQEFQLLLRQMTIEDLSTASLPRKVRDARQDSWFDDNFLLDHDVWG